jgi:hypothetical protein
MFELFKKLEFIQAVTDLVSVNQKITFTYNGNKIELTYLSTDRYKYKENGQFVGYMTAEEVLKLFI